MKTVILFLLALFTICAWAPPVAAAESYDNCTGYVTSVPAVITTSGTWCLNKDLSTSISSGTAISINANNVTLNCNDFKIGGLAAGLGTAAVGVGSMQRSNVTVRRCNVRGFLMGISLAHNSVTPPAPPSGNVIEANRVDGSTWIGIDIGSDGGQVTGNIVTNTGGNLQGSNPMAIQTSFGTDIIGNVVDGMFVDAQSTVPPYAIVSWNNLGGSISGNRIRSVTSNSWANGIFVASGSAAAVAENTIHISSPSDSSIACGDESGSQTVVARNILLGAGSAITGCFDGGGNVTPL